MDKDILIPLVKGNYIPKKDGLIPFVRGNGLTTSGVPTEQEEETDKSLKPKESVKNEEE